MVIIKATFLVQIASDLPFHAYFLVLYVIPVYFMVNMPADVAIFFQVRPGGRGEEGGALCLGVGGVGGLPPCSCRWCA